MEPLRHSVRLSRILAQVAPSDPEGIRAWIRRSVDTEITLIGRVRSRLILVGPGFAEVLYLDVLARLDAAADTSATWRSLRATQPDRRHLAVWQDPDSSDQVWIIEEGAANRLSYDIDPSTGLGLPGDWQTVPASNASPLAHPPAPDALAAQVLPPRAPRADVGVQYGSLPPSREAPDDPLALIELVSHMIVGELLTGEVRGQVIVRFARREFEAFQLPNASPVDLGEFIRHVCNVQQPVAHAVALVQIAIQPQDDPPQPGVQVLAEVAGQIAETWSPIAFPHGPDHPAEVIGVQLKRLEPTPSAGHWLGVLPTVGLSLTSPTVGET